MTAELQTNRYDQLVRRAGGIIGPGSKVSEALSELFPTMDVENVPGELLYLMGWRLGFGGIQVSAGVGDVARIQLFNPVGSGNLVTISGFVAAVSSTQRLRFSVGATPLTSGVGINNVRDTRQGAAQLTTTQLRTDETVAKTDSQGTVILVSNTSLRFEDRNGIAILSPGNGFEVGCDTTNTALTVTFFYRERTALESELLFP